MFKRFMLLVPLALVLVFISQMPLMVHSQDDMDMSGKDLPLETRQLIDDVRQATADFREVSKAEDAGYGIFQDCFKDDRIGGMGQHYVNGDFVGDDVLDPLKPEAVVYEPGDDGQLYLVALEYLVFESNWKQSDPPMLFGQQFHLNTTIPDTPPAWTLHIWLWSHNPEGLFASYNPIIFCPEDAA